MTGVDHAISANPMIVWQMSVDVCLVPGQTSENGQLRSVSGTAEIDGILHWLPTKRHEMSAASFRDLLVIVKYGIAGGMLLYTMISCSHLPGLVGISSE